MIKIVFIESSMEHQAVSDIAAFLNTKVYGKFAKVGLHENGNSSPYTYAVINHPAKKKKGGR